MKHSRAILALFAIAAVITGTAGYDTIQADRGVDVETAGDDSAYLALTQNETAIENGTTGRPVEITNQFGTSVEVTVEVTSIDSGITVKGLTQSTLNPGDTAAVKVTCETSSDQSLTLDVRAENDELSVELRNREFTVDCASSGS
jgi:hypothetical protein